MVPLICTRGQGPRLYTRNGFAVCTSLFLQLCILCAPCVQVVLYRSSAVVLRVKSYSIYIVGSVVHGMLPPTYPTHPPTPTQRYFCVCTVGNECKSNVCYHPPPPHPPQPKGMCVCVYSWECVQVQGMLPFPPHPPTPKVCVCVCVQMSPQKHVVCTDGSDLCAQMRLLGCVYR